MFIHPTSFQKEVCGGMSVYVSMCVCPLAEEAAQRGEGSCGWNPPRIQETARFSGCSSRPLTACFSAAVVPWSSPWQSARGSKCTENCVLIEGFTSDTDLKWGRNFLFLSQSEMHFAAREMLVITSSSYIILLFSIAAGQSQVMVSWEQKGGRFWAMIKKKKSHPVISRSYRSLERKIIIFVMMLFKIIRTCIAKLDMQKWVEYCLMAF